jgi:SAM-dependent methyltransferase
VGDDPAVGQRNNEVIVEEIQMDEKKDLRTTFDHDAYLYEKARPGYPDALFEDIIEFSKISVDDRILEIGCGTAQATLPFALRGYSIHCIELGENLAAVAKQNLSDYPKVQVSVGSFEEYPLEENGFDMVISGTAFHWIDPNIGYWKAAKVLKPEGTLALFWNKPVQTQISAEMVQSIQNVYERVVPEMAKRFPGLVHPDAIPTPVKDEIDRSGLFGIKYRWEAEYSAKAYIELLNTYSDHVVLEKEIRTELYSGIENQIETQFGGRIVKEHLSILYLAHRN